MSEADDQSLSGGRSFSGGVAHLTVAQGTASQRPVPSQISFNRQELGEILKVYGRAVADGEWRDYAMDFFKEKAIFSVFKRASEVPVYRIEKNPKLARKQGAYSIVAQSGLIVKRGHDLKTVLKFFDRKKLHLVE